MTSGTDRRGTDGHIQGLHALLADRIIPTAERGAAAPGIGAAPEAATPPTL